MNYEDLSVNIQKKVVENNYEYIKVKAQNYLEIGANKYREQDAFGYPLEEWDKNDLKQLKDGCKQILKYKGLTEKSAFEGLSVSGFYKLMEMFHFEFVRRETNSESDFFNDKIVFKHRIAGFFTTLYNKLKKIHHN